MSLDTYYELYRSRNNGEFWSRLHYGHALSYDQAVELLESEHKAHPSDWLRVVKIENTIEKEYLGNAKN